MDFSFLQTFVMLSGQVADGLTTIFAGELVSLKNTDLGILKYGILQDLSWLLSHFLPCLAVACLANLLVLIRPCCKLLVTVCSLQSSMWDGLLLKYRTCPSTGSQR
ncbi:uncharacterized protein [Solanum lycopersicum]|uniref:uncharacterized protein isoform X3 n=1 Tax=Solanum lycopersicum TaxID=4081 RepID=UPI0037481003